MNALGVAEILSPIPLETFLNDYWGREFLVQQGDPARFASLVTWDFIGQTLRHHSWQPETIRVFSGGAPVNQQEFLREDNGFHHVQVDAVESLLGAGALLSLNAVDRRFPSIRRLAREFEFVFRERMQVNLYAGYSGSKGFHPHWDAHDVIVLQISGSKLWRIYGRTSEAPLYRDLLPDEVAPRELVWTGELKSGGFLYLPRGVWHDAEATDEPTIHLTFGIDRVTGIDVLDWLQKELRKSAIFRADLPRFASAEQQREHGERLRAELLAMLEGDFVQRFLEADDMRAPAVRLGGLTGGHREGKLRWLPPRPVTLTVEQTLGRFIELDSMGQHWYVPRWTEAVLRAIAESREMTRREVLERIGGQYTPRDVEEAVAYLIGKGLIEEIGRD